MHDISKSFSSITGHKKKMNGLLIKRGIYREREEKERRRERKRTYALFENVVFGKEYNFNF